MTDTTSANDFIGDLRNAAVRNPLSAALIGMGVLWLLTGARSPQAVGSAILGAGERIPDTVSNVREGLKNGVDTLADATSSSMEKVRQQSGVAVNTVSEYGNGIANPGASFDRARDGLAELFRAQPLALGVVGLAIGAGMAAALPKTGVEDSYLGEASGNVKTRVSELVDKTVDSTAALAGNVIDAASDEARRQGLTVDNAKATVRDFTAKLGRVADSAKNPVAGK
jgi:hypothetical protein